MIIPVTGGGWALTEDPQRRVFATEQEARMAQIEPFAVEYERRMRALLEQTRTLVKEVQDLAADDAANQYGAQIDAAPDGAPVGDSTLPKEGAAAIRAVFGSFLAWLDAPLPAVGDATPAQLLRRRF